MTAQLPDYTPDQGPLRKALPETAWREVMRAVCAHHGLSDVDLSPFPTGSDIVWGGSDFVIKLTAPRWRAELEAEARCLAHTAGRLSVATPGVLATGDIEDWPYVVMTRLDDMQPIGAVWKQADHAARLALAANVGRIMAELHALPLPEEPSAWDEFIAAQRTSVTERHQRTGVDEAWLPHIERFVGDAHRPTDRLALLHTELLDEHMLVRPDDTGWRIAGIIDFADARVGDPRYEIAAPIEFLFRGEAGCLRRCLEAMGWDAAAMNHETSLALARWGLLHQFGSLARVTALAPHVSPGDWDGLARAVYALADGCP